MSARPFVSVVIPAYNEELYMEACLRTLRGQDYPAERMELLVADGGSTDKTREIIARVAAEDPRVRLVDNSADRVQSKGKSLAMQQAKGDYILAADVHADYAGDYVSKLVEVFERTGADAAGGAARAKAETWFQKALCAALSSPLGVGGAAYRCPDTEGWVDTLFPGAFRRSILEKSGLFDAHAVTNEDAELFYRIHKAGGRAYLSREVVVYYYPRKSLVALAKQYFKYGDGRARTLLVHKGLPVIRPLIPFSFVMGGLTLILVPPLQPLAPLAFGAYAAITGIEAFRVGRKEGLWAVPVVWAIFPTLHISHGIGMLEGLIRHSLDPKPPAVDRLAPRPRRAASSQGAA